MAVHDTHESAAGGLVALLGGSAERTGDLILHDGIVWTSAQAEALVASVNRLVERVELASFAHSVPQEVT